MLQCYCVTAMLDKLCIPDSCFDRVLKRSLSAQWMHVKLFFVTFNLNCRLHAVSVRKPSEWMSNFCRFGFLHVPVWQIKKSICSHVTTTLQSHHWLTVVLKHSVYIIKWCVSNPPHACWDWHIDRWRLHIRQYCTALSLIKVLYTVLSSNYI